MKGEIKDAELFLEAVQLQLGSEQRILAVNFFQVVAVLSVFIEGLSFLVLSEHV